MSTIDLPPEIMYIIFELVYAQSPQVKIHDWDYWPWQPNPYEKIPKIKEHPLLDVMLVSSTWHSLIAQNSSLWTHVVLESDVGGPSRRRWLTPAVTCIERSKSSPLNITILMTSKTIFDAKKVLRPHSDRWRMLSVFPVTAVVLWHGAERGFYQLFGGSTFPRLLSLNLWGTVRSVAKGISRLSFPGMAMSISAPNLTTISLPWFSSQFLVLSDPLPPQVAVLKLPSRMTHLPNVMPNPAALRSLCVMIERSADCFEDLDLPHLSHLRVAFWDSPMTPWLDYLRSIDRFPNLESLSIIMPNRYTHIPLPSLPNIHFLEWVEGPLGIAASFRAILAACPNLLHLACIPLGTMYDDVTNTNLSVVTERIATGPFELLEQVTQTGELEYCPHLRTLCVEGYRVELDGPLAVRPMLRLGGWNRHSWMGKSDVSERGLPAAAGL